MAKEIEIQNLKKAYPDFFEKAPAELIDFVLSEKTSFKITEICKKNGVTDEEKIEKIAYRITLVLLEKLAKEKLAVTLEGGVGLTPQIAQKTSQEVNQLIFSPVKNDLAKLHQKKVSLEKPAEEPEEEPKKPPGKDVYRELTE